MESTQLHELEIAAGPFTPDFESLRAFECPAWFQDAKFGIWSHWGPQSVPMYGDWYARNMYIEGHEQYRHHWRVYGHPSKVGYKDILPLWKAENFDPHGLMRLFVEAGAKYFFGQAMHHDNFDNFDSQHNRWNSINIGPKRDIVGLWRDAAKAHGLPFCLSEHLGASFNWFTPNKGMDQTGPYAGVAYDGCDPAYEDLYYKNQGYSLENGNWVGFNWYTDNPDFQRHWFLRIKDFIDKYQPDGIYTDGYVPFGEIGLRIIAHLYNTSAALHGGTNQAIYTQKDTDPAVHRIGVLDIERGQMDEIAQHTWQTDTSIGDWFYNVRDVYKTPNQVLESLVDIVSKNGCLLLNVPQRPDGTIDDECRYLLQRLAGWMKGSGEGIFGSRPWLVSGEGPTSAKSGMFNESALQWTPQDFRFTSRGNTIYAFQMKAGKGEPVVIRSLAEGRARTVRDVRLLGYGTLEFQQGRDGLGISPAGADPIEGPTGYAISID